MERIIEQILSERPDISREELLNRLEREKKKTGGLIQDRILLRMIAAEFGVEIPNNEVLAPFLSIKDLVPGLNDITVVGKVIAVFSPIVFEGKRSGRLASLLVADKSGVLRVVLWNDRTSLIESGKVVSGQILRFVHGYTREDRGGKVELHISEKSEVEVNPKDVDATKYSTVGVLATKIGEIVHAHINKKVNIAGTVRDLFAASDFKRQDSSSGRVMRFVLADETGEMPVVVWNEKVDEIEKILEKGVRLQIVNAKVKKALGGKLEVHVDGGTYVEALAFEEVFLKVADLKQGLNRVNVEGEVATKPILRDVKTSNGETVKLAIFELKDETGKIWFSAWRGHVDDVKDLGVGEKIIVKNAIMRKGFGDQLELSTRTTTEITLRSNKNR